jgi:hypothetical protein
VSLKSNGKKVYLGFTATETYVTSGINAADTQRISECWPVFSKDWHLVTQMSREMKNILSTPEE